MSSNPSDTVEYPGTHRTTRSTRSGRNVRAPTRYEPDPNVVLEDDYSDNDEYMSGSESDDSFVSDTARRDDDEEFVSDIGDSEDESESEDEGSVMDEEDTDEESEPDEYCDEDIEDVLDFDCLTDNATDGSMSSDEED